MKGELVPFPIVGGGISSELGQECARKILDLSPADRAEGCRDLHTSQPETLLALCQLIDERLPASPAKTMEDAVWAYELLESDPSAHAFLFDEREYYLGELSLLAGMAARGLGRREEARKFFDRADAWFLLTVNPSGDMARVSYQRLALKVEEREFEEVERLAGPLADAFTKSGAKEHALKCKYLKAVALREADRVPEAQASFEAILEEAKQLGSSRMVQNTLVVLIQIHSQYGDAEKAFSLAGEATPLLRSANDRVLLGKLKWGLGTLLRAQGKLGDSIDVFRSAQEEFREIGMRPDVAAIHLVIADLLLDNNQERQAEWEIRAALPIIDDVKMVPEGFAAMTLLRESLRRRSIDRQALRKLHGYFEEAGS